MKKTLATAAALLLAFSMTSCSSEAAPTDNTGTSASSAPAVTEAETEAPESAPEETDPSASGQEYADATYAAWLASYGAQSNTEILAQLPESVQGYLVSAESPVPGTVVFTAQLTEGDVEEAELDETAMAVLQLVGYEDESLDRVEVVTADSLARGVANRRDSPLLAD